MQDPKTSGSFPDARSCLSCGLLYVKMLGLEFATKAAL